MRWRWKFSEECGGGVSEVRSGERGVKSSEEEVQGVVGRNYRGE